MTKTTRKLVPAVGILLLAFITTSSMNAQAPPECVVKQLSKPKFRIANSYVGRKVGFDLAVKPARQTDDYLRALATYFKQQYCAADQIIITVFDNRSDAHAFSVNNVAEIPDTARAMYFLNRLDGREKLVRVTVVNNSQVETPIDLK